MKLFNCCKWQLMVFFTIFTPLAAVMLLFPGLTIFGDNGELSSLSDAAILFPRFLLEFSHSGILLIVRVTNVFFVALCGVVAYNIMTGIFDVDNKKLTVITSIAAACIPYSIRMINMLYNDNMHIFFSFLILYILLVLAKRVELKKSNIVLSLFLSISICLGFLVQSSILSNTMGHGGHMPVSEMFKAFFSISGMIAFVRLVLGQAYSIFVFTGGLAPLLFVSLVLCLIFLIWKKTRHRAAEFVKENKILFCAIVYTIVQLSVIVILTSFERVYDTRLGVDLGWLLYFRSWPYAASPVLILSIVLFQKLERPVAKKLLIIAAAFIIAHSILFSYLAAPLLFNSEDTFLSYYAPVALAKTGSAEGFTPDNFLVMTIFAWAITLASFILIRKRRFVILSVIILVFSLYHYSYITIRQDIPQSNQMADEYDKQYLAPECYKV